MDDGVIDFQIRRPLRYMTKRTLIFVLSSRYYLLTQRCEENSCYAW